MLKSILDVKKEKLVNNKNVIKFKFPVFHKKCIILIKKVFNETKIRKLMLLH